MSISTYSELQTAILNWISRPDLSASRVQEFIALAETRIYRELRIRAMEGALNVTLSSGVAAIPSDYMELKHAYIDGSPTKYLIRQTAQYIYETYPTRSSTAKPQYIAQDGSNFIFGPFPDSNYTLKGTYYKRLPALSDANTTNWFTDNAPDILLFASLVESHTYTMDDERLAIWEARYNDAKAMITKEESRQRRSGLTHSIAR